MCMQKHVNGCAENGVSSASIVDANLIDLQNVRVCKCNKGGDWLKMWVGAKVYILKYMAVMYKTEILVYL